MRKSSKRMNYKNTFATNPFRFSIAIFGLTLITQVFHAFNFSYYVDGGLITMAMATICKIIFVIVDGLNDIVFGYLSEKTNTKWGKRLPWLVGFTPLLPLVVAAAYMVNINTGWSQLGFFAYYLFISITLENLTTILYINYGALFPTLFEPGKQRNDVSTISKIFEISAVAVAFIFTPIINKYVGGYQGTALIFGVMFILIMGYTISGIKYKDLKQKEIEESLSTRANYEEKFSLRQTFKDFFGNKQFVIYGLSNGCFQAILALFISLFPMYIRYVLNININDSSSNSAFATAILFGSTFLSAGIGMIFWYKAINKWGYRKIWKYEFMILPVLLIMLAFPFNFVSAVVILCIIGLFIGGLMTTPNMMNAELVDIDKMKHGQSREASIYSMNNILNRFVVCMVTIITTIVSFLFGYHDGTNPGSNPSLTFRIIFGGVLGLVALVGAVLAIKYYALSRRDSRAILKENGIDYNQTIEFNRVKRDADDLFEEEVIKHYKKKKK